MLNFIPDSEKRITASTLLTIVRILLVPIIVGSMVTGWWEGACVLFAIASITDMFDGTLARWYNEQTLLGACLDPIADKLLLVSVFATLAFVHTPLFAIPQWFVGLVLMRELIIVGGSLGIWIYQGSLTINPTFLGKMTTLMQVIFIMWLFACYFFAWMPVKTYYVMFGLMLVMVISSLIQYICIGLRFLIPNKGSNYE